MRYNDRLTKNVLSDVVFQVRQELLIEQQCLFSSLEQKINMKIHEITEQISTLKQNFEAEHEALFNGFDSELEERLNRRCNLVLHGVEKAVGTADATARRVHDQNALDTLLKTMNIPDDPPSIKVRRIGIPSQNTCKSRLLHIVCKDDSTRNNILRNRTLLRTLDKKVIVQSDMTPMQQQAARILRFELKRRRDMGENVVIRNNKIVFT